MTKENFDPRSLSTLSKSLEDTCRVHLYRGYLAGAGAALDVIREYFPANHPVRMKVYDLLFSATEENVADLIAASQKLREERLREHNRARGVQ